MKHRFLSILLASVLLLGAISCDTGTSPETDGTTEQSTTQSIETDDTTDVPSSGDLAGELTVWCWDPAFNIYAMETAAKYYSDVNADATINVVETPWDDVQTKLTTAVTSQQLDTLPDIFLMQDNAFQKNVLNYPHVFKDLTNTDIDFSEFAEAKTAYSVVEGKNYGVPFDNGTVVTAYRTDYLEEAGLTVDDFTGKTWTEWMDEGDKVVEAGYPMISMTPEPDIIMMMMQSAGASLFDDEGNPTLTDNPVLKEVVEVYVELIERDLLLIVNDWDQYVGSITNGTVAGTTNGCWILGSVQTAEDQAGKWTISDMPRLEVDGATNYSNNGGSSWAVTTVSESQDLAVDFLNHTFAGSVEFYEEILPSSGAIATYLPAGSSDVYAEPIEFFADQPIYQVIVEMGAEVKSNNTGVYYYEARDAVGTAIQAVMNGAEIDAELQRAQETVEFQMGG